MRINNQTENSGKTCNMDSRFWLVLTLAVPLVSPTSGTRFSPTTVSTTDPPAVPLTSSSTATEERTSVTVPAGVTADLLTPTQSSVPTTTSNYHTPFPTTAQKETSGTVPHSTLETTSDVFPTTSSAQGTTSPWAATQTHATNTAVVFSGTSSTSVTSTHLLDPTTISMGSPSNPTTKSTAFPTDPTPNSTPYPTDLIPNSTPYHPDPTPNSTPYPTDLTSNSTPYPTDPTPNSTPYPPDPTPNSTPYPTDPTPNSTPYPPFPTPNSTPYPTDFTPNSTPYPIDPTTNSTHYPTDATPNSTPYPTDPTTTTTPYPHPTTYSTTSTYPTTTSPPILTTNITTISSATTNSTFRPSSSSTTTPTPTIFTTTRPPALTCSNGGKEVNGVCVCPDEWTGETCTEGNFCKAKTLGKFNFQDTPNGWFAYSEEKCSEGTSGAGNSKASTRCSLRGGSLSFETPREFKCDQTLADIQLNLTSGADIETLASSAQILTSKPENLQSENVTTAAQIANMLLLSPNASESVRVSAVATVSQLLNANVKSDAANKNATQELTLTLDTLSLNLSSSSNISQVVQPNLVVQSTEVQTADSQGVQFTSLAGVSGSFVANRIQLNTNVSKITVESGFIADALVYVKFPPGVRGHQKSSTVSLGFVLYQNDRFFPSTLYKKQRATIRVLSASIGGPDRSVVPQHVEMLFRRRSLNGTFLHDFSCVFWDYTLKDWSTTGCSKGNASDEVLRCFCNHTTNFAALWSYREDYEYAEALGVLSIVGLCFSILGLVITIIHHINENFCQKSRERQTKLNSKMSLLCIYTSLLVFILTFLSGVQNSTRQSDIEVEPSTRNDILDSDLHVERDQGSCTVVAALLHYFLLATFLWNSVYGTQLVLLVRSMRRSLPSHWTPLSIGIGWGVPAVVMAITLGVTYRVDNPLRYRQEEFCWLAALDHNKDFSFEKPMFWAFLLPVGLILIYNIILLILTSLTTCRDDPKLTSTNQSSLTKKFLVSFSLAILLGLSWTLGYFVLVTSEQAHLVFSILFCICTTTQGFQIFILFTARTRSFRTAVLTSVQYVSSVSTPLNSAKYHVWKNWNQSRTSEAYKDILNQETSV